MRLVRRLVLSELFFNILFRAKLYREKLNVAADHLSRFLKFQEAKMLAPWLKLQPTLLPLKIVYIKQQGTFNCIVSTINSTILLTELDSTYRILPHLEVFIFIYMLRFRHFKLSKSSSFSKLYCIHDHFTSLSYQICAQTFQCFNALNFTVSDRNNILLLRAIFLLVFHAFFRLGELVVRDKEHAVNMIQRADLTFIKDQGIQINLKYFKHIKPNQPFSHNVKMTEYVLSAHCTFTPAIFNINHVHFLPFNLVFQSLMPLYHQT